MREAANQQQGAATMAPADPGFESRSAAHAAAHAAIQADANGRRN